MPRPFVRWTALAAAALVTASCSDVLIAPPPSAQSPLFEVEYINYAWGPQWKGFYVDAQDNVYSFDLAASNERELADSVLTPEQVDRKYGHARTLVKTLSAGEARAEYDHVGAAAAGSYTDYRPSCADAGGTRFSAWIYEPSDGRYHRLLLHLRGDYAQANRSDAARDLYHWLENVTGTADPEKFCDPFD